ncbi:MAG TPA: MarR family winged helix-turn-helix transcriptional regulator [Granulicella sp.]|nr:MarR family winged helix-turn-helix transcriptional regulator [Granulicella sp.]
MRIESFLKQSPVFQVNRIARKMGASLNLILRDEELTAIESLILAAIFLEKKAEINPSRLAETFETTRGNISHCLSSLEAKGLVQRRIDPEDARAFRLALLPKGRRQAARVAGILDRMQRHFEESVGARELQTMLDRMRDVEELCARLAEVPRSG